jgi:ATP-binding cassette subfamily C protein CydC
VQLDGWVQSLPDSLDTLVGEEGDLVSGGQRHRLTLARALLSDARFLILDEPTAHLDSDTAAAVIAGICEAAGDQSILAISHRLEGFESFTAVRLEPDGHLH